MPSLYAELISQLAWPNDSVSQNLRMIHGEIGRLTNKLVSIPLYQTKESADFTSDDIRMPLYLWKRCFLSLSQKWTLNRNGFLAQLWIAKRKIWLIITDLIFLTQISNSQKLPTLLPVPDHSSFQTHPSLLVHCLLSAWRVFRTFLPLYQILLIYFKTKVELPYSHLVPAAPVFRFRKEFLTGFRKLRTIGPIIWYT